MVTTALDLLIAAAAAERTLRVRKNALAAIVAPKKRTSIFGKWILR